MPTVTWRKALGSVPKEKTAVINGNMSIVSVTKADGGTYACSPKNLLGEDSAVALVAVIDRLTFTLTPPIKFVAPQLGNLMLNCKAQGSIEVSWNRKNQNLPQNHVIFSNGTLFLTQVTTSDARTYTCVAKNYKRTIKASSTVLLLKCQRKRLVAALNQAAVKVHQVIILLTLMAKEV